MRTWENRGYKQGNRLRSNIRLLYSIQQFNTEPNGYYPSC